MKLSLRAICWTLLFISVNLTGAADDDQNYVALAAKVEQQATLIEALGVRLQQLEAQVNGKETSANDLQESVTSLEKKVLLQEAAIDKLKTLNPKTCDGIRQSDPEKESGMYWIDPDGHGQGDPPIFVYCNMTTGTTSISHGSEEPTDVGHCKTPGCYSQPVKYNATMKQMMALVQQSVECRQLIQYECLGAPLEFNGITYSWWNDRHGVPQYFWAGSGVKKTESSVIQPPYNPRARSSRINRNTSSTPLFEHTCQCGIDEDCIDAHITCNCDSLEPQLNVDSGYITNKTLLPITKLNFGRTASRSSSGRHTLGKLECSGSQPFQGLPGSCEDLRRIGHQLSGFYQIHNANKTDTVYCDMGKLPGDKDLQTLISSNTPVYFYLQKNSSFSSSNTVIPFEYVQLNIGEAMNVRTGIFTAPVAGVYYFSFSGQCYPAMIHLYKNDATMASAFGSSNNGYKTCMLSSILELKAGDQIKLFLASGQIYEVSSSSRYTHFVGMLLNELPASNSLTTDSYINAPPHSEFNYLDTEDD